MSEAYIFSEVWKTVYEKTGSGYEADKAAYWAVSKFRRMIK